VLSYVTLCAGYTKLESATFIGGHKIDITLQFRTLLSNGLMLFAFGGTGTWFILQLRDGSLLWSISINGKPDFCTFDLISLCDGRWHVAQLVREGTQMKLTIDRNRTLSSVSFGGDPYERAERIVLSSYLYVGGIPDDDEASTFIRSNQLQQAIQPSQLISLV